VGEEADVMRIRIFDINEAAVQCGCGVRYSRCGTVAL
jgi:hypothetical protein